MSTKEDIASYAKIGEPTDTEQRMLVRYANSFCEPGTHTALIDEDGKKWKCVPKGTFFNTVRSAPLTDFPVTGETMKGLKVGIPFMDEYCGKNGYRIERNPKDWSAASFKCGRQNNIPTAEAMVDPGRYENGYFPAYAGLGENAPVMTYETANSMCQNGQAIYGKLKEDDNKYAFRCMNSPTNNALSPNYWNPDVVNTESGNYYVPTKETTLPDGTSLSAGRGNRLLNAKDLSKFTSVTGKDYNDKNIVKEPDYYNGLFRFCANEARKTSGNAYMKCNDNNALYCTPLGMRTSRTEFKNNGGLKEMDTAYCGENNSRDIPGNDGCHSCGAYYTEANGSFPIDDESLRNYIRTNSVSKEPPATESYRRWYR